MQAAQDQQKSYADRKRKPMEFEWNQSNAQRSYPLERSRTVPVNSGGPRTRDIGLSSVSKSWKVMPLEEIHVDDKLQFVEEPVEIMEREIKRLKRSRILLVKVRWNSRRGPKFTWEREDSFKQKYPQLFTNRGSSSATRS
ncbi:hypothetical protein Tco_0895592 [Tanacetum coccineum]|uniref:Reverse transcriptase domain-containing protein n=1 Tax=Tanacetum coccineum TaxID=301880 RepID=A0ABQ5CFD4_9ASTR